MTRPDWKETVGAATVVAILLGLPLILWAWRDRTLHHHPAGTKVIQLTAIADHGVWTEDEVVGWNYWWKKPTRVNSIQLQQGDYVVLRLRSADVLHSFAIPIAHLGPIEIPAGHTVQMEFRADRAGTLTFLCWQLCGPDHQMLQGQFVVRGNANQEDTW